MLKRLFKETVVYGASRYIGKFIGVFLLPLYTAALTTEDYGILDVLNTIPFIGAFLIVSGTDAALSYFYFRKEFSGEKHLMISSALWIRIMFALVILAIIVVLSPYLTNLMFGRDYKIFVWLTALTLLFNCVYSFLQDLLRFELRPWLYTLVTSSSVLVHILITVYFVLILKQGVYGALLASSIAYGIFFLISCIYVFKRYGIGFSGKWAKSILVYGSPLIGTGVAVWVLGSTDRYFLAHYKGLDINGIYAVGSKLASFMGMVAGALQLAWGPFAMDIQYEKKAKSIYAKVFLLFSIVNVLAVFGISMFAIDLLKVFTQPDYYSAKAVVPFLCFSTVLSSAYFIVAVGISVTKKLQHTVWITVSAAVLNILMNTLLTPKLGAIGAAFSLMSANFLIFVLTLIISQKYYKIDFRYQKVLFVLIPSVIIITLSYYYDLRLVPRIILSSVFLIFSGLYLYYNFKDTEDFKRLLERIKNLKNKPIEEEIKDEIEQENKP